MVTLPPVMVKGKELPLQVYEALRSKVPTQTTARVAIPVLPADALPPRKPQ